MSRLYRYSWVVNCILLCLLGRSPAAVRTGLDNLAAYQSLFENKRVGIVANHTACDRSGKSILDCFRDRNITVTALFGPEHGFTGVYQAGQKVHSVTDANDMPPVYSLYGQHHKPTAEMLHNVDVLVFDIQDIGTRYYTYIYTMAGSMESAAEHGKQFVVLDRPNPINGITVQGNLVEPEFASSVGRFPIPTRHGMTVGELARLFNDQGWLQGAAKAVLTVIPMTGYDRRMWYPETGLAFISPSPNMPSVETAAIYPGTCLLEGTNVSEGRGTDSPFLLFGAPWVNAAELTARLNALNLPGIAFEPAEFTPTFSKHAETVCRGAKIIIRDRDRMDPFWAGICIVDVLYTLYPEQVEFRNAHFDRLCGTDNIRKTILAGASLEPLMQGFQPDVDQFKRLRQQYLLY